MTTSKEHPLKIGDIWSYENWRLPRRTCEFLVLSEQFGVPPGMAIHVRKYAVWWFGRGSDLMNKRAAFLYVPCEVIDRSILISRL